MPLTHSTRKGAKFKKDLSRNENWDVALQAVILRIRRVRVPLSLAPAPRILSPSRSIMKNGMTIAYRVHLVLIAVLIAAPSADAQSWSGATSGAWLTTTNWTGGVEAGSTTSFDTDIAVFNVANQPTVGINMSTTGGVWYLGAIDYTNSTARTINNSSTTVPGVLTLNGATVNSVANTIIRNSSTGLLTITNGTGSGTMGLGLGNPTTNVIQVTGSGGVTINSIISGVGGIATRGSGAGVVTLAGNNTYTGVTAISNSTVTVTNANGLGSNTAGNHTTITYTGGLNGSGGRLFLSGGITVAENITITGNNNTGGAGFNPAIGSSSGTNTFSGTITLTGTDPGSTIRLGVGTTIFSGTITQTGNATGLGLQDTTTVSNPITINGGAVTVIGGSSVVTLNGVSGSGIGNAGVAQGGTLVLGVTNALNTTANLSVGAFGATDTGTVSLNGTDQTVNALVTNSATIQTGSRIVRNNSATTASTLTVGNGGGSGTFNGVIQNGAAATLALVKAGAGNQTLVNTNTFTGGTRIDAGILTLGHATDTITGAVNVNGGTLALGTNSDTVGAVTLTSGSITSSTGVLTGTSYAVQSGSVSAILGGSGIALTKSTAGTVTLTGNNTYTGATSVNAGTLIVNGSLAAGSAVSVGANGTLGGTGTINGAVTITGAHTPGTSPGIQTFASDLTYSGGNSTVQWELVENTTTNPPNPNADYDQVIVGGSLNFAGATALSLVFDGVGSSVLWSDTFWSSNQTWTLYDVSGSTTNFGNLSLAAGSYLDSGSNALASARPGASFSISQTGSDVLISYVAVPEPATIAILGAGVGLLGLRVARRRKA
jgi:autotransporter-associated beta strand protein